MIQYKNEIDSFEELKDLCWGGASQRLDEIEELDLEDEFMDYLQEIFCDETPSLTDINDFIWFDCDDWIEEHKGEEDDD